jgi:hypothetical protein
MLSTDASLECHQHIRGLKETLTIGAIDSEFCNDLRKSIEVEVSKDEKKKDALYTADKKMNPVATPEECKEEPPDGNVRLMAPPNSGSGTGGHR